MNVEVEIVAGEALNALLVPVQALRQMGEQYAVFVVGANGELEMRIVEVGLDGLRQRGDQVRSGAGEMVSLVRRRRPAHRQAQSTTAAAALPGGGFFIPGEGRP